MERIFSIKIRLTLMNFLQFFVWGAWLITIANYWFATKGWGGAEFGAIFSTLGISSIFMPTIFGIIADRWMNAEKLYSILHILSGITVLFFPQINDPHTFFWFMLIAMSFYMPTIALNYSITYNALKTNHFDVVKDFPPIRVWGTVGFIIAMWVTNLSGNKATDMQFYISAAGSILLGLYSLTLPKCPPLKQTATKSSWVEVLGLNAFKLFANYKMALFFLFSMLLGAALQLTNMYGDTFLDDFRKMPIYADSFVVKYSTIIMSISQISETLFILAIPFFLKKFGIKNVMLISMFAWVLRFGLFSYGDPAGGLWMIVLSCIVYGMAFDFFQISGSLFVETTTDSNIRSSAQGLFMMMTNGFGSVIGSVVSGELIDRFFTHNGTKDWHSIWLTFAIYALVVAVLFSFMFKHKHDPAKI
ncbi:MAG: nucleoside permease [Bacteroidales bacterium]|nr:nucleoside permease [Bacteroidales bacterium]